MLVTIRGGFHSLQTEMIVTGEKELISLSELATAYHGCSFNYLASADQRSKECTRIQHQWMGVASSS